VGAGKTIAGGGATEEDWDKLKYTERKPVYFVTKR